MKTQQEIERDRIARKQLRDQFKNDNAVHATTAPITGNIVITIERYNQLLLTEECYKILVEDHKALQKGLSIMTDAYCNK